MVRRGRLILPLALALVSAVPAHAERIDSSSKQTCKPSVCVSASSYITASCELVGDDTVECDGRLVLFGQVGTVELYPGIRWAGSAEWRRRGGCGFWLKGGYVQDCSWFDETESRTWTYQGFGSEYFIHEQTFGPVTHTSTEPFCLTISISGSSTVSATTNLLGLKDHESAQAAAGAQDVFEQACANGEIPG